MPIIFLAAFSLSTHMHIPPKIPPAELLHTDPMGETQIQRHADTIAFTIACTHWRAHVLLPLLSEIKNSQDSNPLHHLPVAKLTWSYASTEDYLRTYFQLLLREAFGNLIKGISDLLQGQLDPRDMTILFKVSCIGVDFHPSLVLGLQFTYDHANSSFPQLLIDGNLACICDRGGCFEKPIWATVVRCAESKSKTTTVFVDLLEDDPAGPSQQNLRSLSAWARLLHELSSPTLEDFQLILDESQVDVVNHVLQNRMAMIQGPPGTGKTFLSGKIVELLLSSDSTKPQKPYIIVPYKNAALDNFLEQCLKFCGIKDVVRAGDRSESDKLESCNLQHLISLSKKTSNTAKPKLRKAALQDASRKAVSNLYKSQSFNRQTITLLSSLAGFKKKIYTTPAAAFRDGEDHILEKWMPSKTVLNACVFFVLPTSASVSALSMKAHRHKPAINCEQQKLATENTERKDNEHPWQDMKYTQPPESKGKRKTDWLSDTFLNFANIDLHKSEPFRSPFLLHCDLAKYHWLLETDPWQLSEQQRAIVILLIMQENKKNCMENFIRTKEYYNHWCNANEETTKRKSATIVKQAKIVGMTSTFAAMERSRTTQHKLLNQKAKVGRTRFKSLQEGEASAKTESTTEQEEKLRAELIKEEMPCINSQISLKSEPEVRLCSSKHLQGRGAAAAEPSFGNKVKNKQEKTVQPGPCVVQVVRRRQNGLKKPPRFRDFSPASAVCESQRSEIESPLEMIMRPPALLYRHTTFQQTHQREYSSHTQQGFNRHFTCNRLLYERECSPASRSKLKASRWGSTRNTWSVKTMQRKPWSMTVASAAEQGWMVMRRSCNRRTQIAAQNEEAWVRLRHCRTKSWRVWSVSIRSFFSFFALP